MMSSSPSSASREGLRLPLGDPSNGGGGTFLMTPGLMTPGGSVVSLMTPGGSTISLGGGSSNAAGAPTLTTPTLTPTTLRNIEQMFMDQDPQECDSHHANAARFEPPTISLSSTISAPPPPAPLVGLAANHLPPPPFVKVKTEDTAPLPSWALDGSVLPGPSSVNDGSVLPGPGSVAPLPVVSSEMGPLPSFVLPGLPVSSSVNGFALPGPGSVLPGPGFVLPGPGSVLPGPGSVLPGPGSVLPGPASALPGPSSTLPGPASVLPGPTSTLPSTVNAVASIMGPAPVMPGPASVLPSPTITVNGSIYVPSSHPSDILPGPGSNEKHEQQLPPLTVPTIVLPPPPKLELPTVPLRLLPNKPVLSPSSIVATTTTATSVPDNTSVIPQTLQMPPLPQTLNIPNVPMPVTSSVAAAPTMPPTELLLNSFNQRELAEDSSSPPAAPPARKDNSLTPEERNRKELRRMRNKEAAARCRKRRLDQTMTLQEEVDMLEQDRNDAQADVQALEAQKAELEALLRTHRTECKKVNNNKVIEVKKEKAT